MGQQASRSDTSKRKGTENRGSSKNVEPFGTGVVDGARQLARRVGNASYVRQSAGIGGTVVQRTPQENLNLLTAVPGTAPDNSATTGEGSKDDTIRTAVAAPFVINNPQDVVGTWHHIYPRNLLKKHLPNISRYLVATNGHEAQMTTTANSSHTAIQAMAANWTMSSGGKIQRKGQYYWKHGNGYAGVLSSWRTDDPGPLVEHKKPASMSSSKYKAPREWGKEIEKLSNRLGNLGSLTLEDVDTEDSALKKSADLINRYSTQLDGDAYRSVDAKEGKDWVREDDTVAWGVQAKNYKLV